MRTRGPVSAPSSATLERRLGPIDAAAVVVSNVIGSGILDRAGRRRRPSAPAPVGDARRLGWSAACSRFAGAMAYAELATLRPRAGGEYVYLREAFGPLAAFLTGWTSFVAGFSGAIAVTRGDVRGATSDGSSRSPATPRRSSRCRSA